VHIPKIDDIQENSDGQNECNVHDPLPASVRYLKLLSIPNLIF